MVSSAKNAYVTDRDFDTYLAAETSLERVAILKKWQTSGTSMDDRFVRGLLTLPVSQIEILTAFEICSTQSKAAHELWIMDNLLSWDQNIAAVALRAWARNTDKTLWHKLLPIAMIPGLPQRVRYTILDISDRTHGYEIIRTILKRPDWQELSPAFHALLIERALQYDLPCETLTKLSWRCLEDSKTDFAPEHKSLLPAIAWLCRHSEKELKKWLEDSPATIWRDIARSTLETHGSRETVLTKIEKALQKSKEKVHLADKLPSLWSRCEASEYLFFSIISQPCHDSSLIHGISKKNYIKSQRRQLIRQLMDGYNNQAYIV